MAKRLLLLALWFWARLILAALALAVFLVDAGAFAPKRALGINDTG